jgi:hypothetical protein
MDNLWTYGEGIHHADTDLSGFDVEATDGGVGSVDEVSTGRDHLIVDTGFWIFGRKRLLPAGVVTKVDHDAEKVYVNLTKEQIKDAPDLDESLDRTGPDWDRDLYASHFGPFMR